MQFITVALLAVVAIASAAPLSEVLTQFRDFKGTFGKTYAIPQEESARFKIFRDNLDIINKHNALFEAGNSTYTLGVNQFADLTRQEWSAAYLTPMKVSRARQEISLPEVAPQNGVDWRTKNAVTPVKNQQQCGSCWAFSSTGSIEGAHAIASGNLVSLSEQQLVDCSTAQGNHGCNGGLMDYAFAYTISNGGLTTEANYAYTARDGTCQTAKAADHAATIKSYADVPQNQESQLIAAVTKQPVSVAIEADHSSFQLYRSGVFNDATCGTQLDHGVLAVGFDTLSGQDYWIVKNSWGTTWGNQGYIWIAQHGGAAGICGINMMSSYPVA